MKDSMNFITMLLKSLALNFPILCEWEIVFPRVIVVVTKEITKYVSLLKNFNDSKSKNSDFRIFVQSDTNKISDYARNYAQEIADGINPSKGFPIVVTDNPIVDDEATNRFYVFIEDNICFDRTDIGLLHPEVEELETIRNSIMEYQSTSDSNEKTCLYAASLFIKDKTLIQYGRDALIAAIDEMVEKDDSVRDTYGLPDCCLRCLYDFQEFNSFSNIFQKSMANEELMRNSMFFDENYLYISEQFFKEIIAPIRKHSAFSVIMKELVKTGLLVSDKAKGYTVKLNSKTRDGKDFRPRVLRLDASRLSMPGKLSFIDMCEMSKEGKNNV